MNTKTNKQQQIKKQWVIAVIFLFSGFCATAQEWSRWSIEKYVCDEYLIYYQMRERSATSDRNEVEVRFKYHHPMDAHINYIISNDENAETIYRTTIKAGKTETVHAFVDKDKPWSLIIDKLRVGSKDVPGTPYKLTEPCVRTHY